MDDATGRWGWERIDGIHRDTRIEIGNKNVLDSAYVTHISLYRFKTSKSLIILLWRIKH